MAQKERAVLVYFRDSINDDKESTARGTLPEMIPIDISIGFEHNPSGIARQLREDGLTTDVFAAFYLPGTCSDRMADLLAYAQQRPENPIRLYINRHMLAQNIYLQVATALLVTCLTPKNTALTKNGRQLAETLKAHTTPPYKMAARATPREPIMIGSLQSLFTWLLREKYVEARLVGKCLSTWFDCAANPVQDDVNSRARRLIQTQDAHELALLAIQHPFAEVPVKSEA